MQKNTTNPKIFTKAISFFLSVLLIFYAIPSVIFAEFADVIERAENASFPEAETAIDAATYTGVAYEVEELRETSVKHFRLEDGSYVAAQYDYPVHYEDEDGILRDIDNALSEASGGVYANADARIKFAKKITGNEELFTLHDGNTKITFALIGANKGTKATVTNGTDAEEETKLQKMMHLEKLSASVLYADILEGVDLEYIAHSLNIKENIIVKERADSYSYAFSLKLNGLAAELTEDGDILLINEDTDAVQYVIPAPVVYDAKGVHAPKEAAAYTLTDGGNGKYELTVTVSTSWMNAEERTFPVTVDPAISCFNSNVIDTTIDSSSTTSNFNSYNHLYLAPTYQAYWKTTQLPTIPNDFYIADATITLKRSDDGLETYAGAYEVEKDWDATLTWLQLTSSSESGRLGSLLDYQKIAYGVDEPYTFHITSAVDKWYRGANYGVAFKLLSSTDRPMSFHSKENVLSYLRPTLTITYLNLNGTEPYWSYSSHSAGVGGSGSINLATGQLSFAIPTLTTTDGLMPYTPTLVYNSALSGKPYFVNNTEIAISTSCTPFGFKLNILETVIRKNYGDVTNTTHPYYVWSDADGTEHGFYSVSADNTVFIDEDGLQKVLTVQEDGTLTITDDSKLTRTFTSNSVGWHLTSITDQNGNAVVFTYDSSARPTAVSLKPYNASAIKMLDLAYHSGGKLALVYNHSAKEAVIFRYSTLPTSTSFSTTFTNYLRQVEYVHASSTATLATISAYAESASSNTGITVDAKANYEYKSGGRLIRVTDDLAKQRIEYTWLNDKITKVSQYAFTENETKEGQSVSITYGEGYTDVYSSGNDDTINTSDDIVTRYIFDMRGRSTSVYSYAKSGTEIYGATVGVYETQDNVKNNLKEQTVIGGSSVNYLLNGSFEQGASNTDATHWHFEDNARRGTSLEGEGEYSLSLQPGSSATQRVSLTEGDYTISFVYSATVSKNVTAEVAVLDEEGFIYHVEIIPLNVNSGMAKSNAFSTSFAVNSTDSGVFDIILSVTSGSSPSTLFRIDRVMLENNLGASPYSLVNYGHFSQIGYSSSNTAVPISTYWTTDASNAPSTVLGDLPFGTSAKVTGNITSARYVKQRIFEASEDDMYYFTNAGEEYIVSGFAKAENASLSTNAAFRIRIDVHYYQGEGQSDRTISHYYDFLPSVTGWQFTGGSFDTDYSDDTDYIYDCVRAIDVVCEYSYQLEGFALFDNISVINSTGTDIERYYYREDGLVARKENRVYREYYEYDANRNLTRVANNRGELTDYYYTANDLIFESIDYDYHYAGNPDYPYQGAVINGVYKTADQLITKTSKTKTMYDHNDYGQTKQILTQLLDSAENVIIGSKSISQSYEYEERNDSAIVGALLSETDSLGVTTRYYYDSSNGRLMATVNTSTSTGVAYTYDGMGRMIGVRPATYIIAGSYNTVSNAENVTYTYDGKGQLSTITTDSTTYTFTYDLFGNALSTTAGSNTLATYTYNEKNGKLIAITYGNGFVEDYVYNDLEQLVEVYHTIGTKRKLTYSYEYTSDGQVHEFTDHENSVSTAYRYDTNGRLLSMVQYNDNGTAAYQYYKNAYSYNDKGQLLSSYYYLNHQNGSSVKTSSFSHTHFYNTDGSLNKRTVVTPTTSGQETFAYDDYDRLTQSSFSSHLTGTAFGNVIDYTYTANGNKTSGLVQTYKSTVNNGTPLTYTYTYDNNGNITKIVYSTGEEIRYVYDDLGQLIREDNGPLRYTFLFAYDNAGNILKKEVFDVEAAGVTPTYNILTIDYAYSSSEWGDQLTSYRNHTITYDAIGNPLSYYNGKSYTFSWTGRQLTGATVGGNTYAFTYNDEGIRTSKTKNDVTTTYYLSGSQIIAEETQGNVTVYIYDAAGSPIGMQYHGASYAANAWDVYWYEKNLQGDIVAVYNQAGTKLVSYFYDAWGETEEHRHAASLSAVVLNNPFRYRGYYYDADLGLYYVSSRYYDSVIGRWINADIPETLTADFENFAQYNLFAYCFNNPVNLSDETGTWPSWATKLAIGVGAIVIGAAVVAATAATGGAAAAFVGAAVAGLKAAAVSGAIGAAVGAGTSAVSHRVSTGSWSGAGKAAIDGAVDGFASGFMTGGIMAGGSQILSSGFKVAANAGVPTGRNGGLTFGNKVRVLSPNHPQAYEAGGTLLKIGSKYKNIRFDVDNNKLFHMNIQLAKTANYHLPLGILGSGLWGGIARD